MSIVALLLIVLLAALIAVWPRWAHSQRWGYAPSALVGTALLGVLLLVALGRLSL
jgi:Protein of unknown function (DUF3309)